MDGRLAAAPEGPTIAPDAPEANASARDLRELVAELRGICGDEWIVHAEHQLRTYESDGLLQYHAIPAAAVLPGTAEEVRDVVAGVRARRRAVGGARRRLGPVGRRAADRRRRADRARRG